MALCRWFIKEDRTPHLMLAGLRMDAFWEREPQRENEIRTGLGAGWRSLILDAVDASLELEPDPPYQYFEGLGYGPSMLALLLSHSDSPWRVAEDGSALISVTDPATALVLAESAGAAPGDASRFLLDAATACYSRNPDPSRAYSLAIKAVECVAIPALTPNNKRATLGTVRGHLNEARDRYRLHAASNDRDGSVTPVLAMIECLWHGQTDRHGGSEPVVDVDQSSAEIAVHLAVALVHIFSTGKISLRS